MTMRIGSLIFILDWRRQRRTPGPQLVQLKHLIPLVLPSLFSPDDGFHSWCQLNLVNSLPAQKTSWLWDGITWTRIKDSEQVETLQCEAGREESQDLPMLIPAPDWGREVKGPDHEVRDSSRSPFNTCPCTRPHECLQAWTLTCPGSIISPLGSNAFPHELE